MAKDRIMIGISKTTHARLDELRHRLWSNDGDARLAGEGKWDGHVSLDKVISVLLDREDAHRLRSKLSSARRRAVKPPPADEPPNGNGVQP